MQATTRRGQSASQRRRTVASTVLVASLAAATGVYAAPTALPGAPMSTPAGHEWAMAKKQATPVKLVDINSAGRAELKTLPGIGDAEADRIIANRPYLTKTELASKNVLPLGPFISLRRRVVALQATTPASHR